MTARRGPLAERSQLGILEPAEAVGLGVVGVEASAELVAFVEHGPAGRRDRPAARQQVRGPAVPVGKAGDVGQASEPLELAAELRVGLVHRLGVSVEILAATSRTVAASSTLRRTSVSAGRGPTRCARPSPRVRSPRR